MSRQFLKKVDTCTVWRRPAQVLRRKRERRKDNTRKVTADVQNKSLEKNEEKRTKAAQRPATTDSRETVSSLKPLSSYEPKLSLLS